MNTAIIEINPDWKAALKAGAKGIRQAAQSGRAQQSTFSYASPKLLFSEISPKRWGVLEAMSGAGEMSLRELARRLERDVKSVHRDSSRCIRGLPRGLISRLGTAAGRCSG